MSFPRCRFHVVAVLQGGYIWIINKDFDCSSIILECAFPSCHFHVVASTFLLSGISLNFNLVSILNMEEIFYLHIFVIFSCLFSFRNKRHFVGSEMTSGRSTSSVIHLLLMFYIPWLAVRSFQTGGEGFRPSEVVKPLFYYSLNIIRENKNTWLVTQTTSVTRELEKL